MATKPTFTQTRDPKEGRFTKDPSRSYLLVERETSLDGFESLLETYTENTVKNNGEDMYIDHGYVPGMCKSKKFSLLSCSKEDYEAHLKDVAERTRKAMKTKDKGLDIAERESRPVSLEQMGANLPQAA